MHFPIGPFANGTAIILGSLLGVWFGGKVPERIRQNLIPLFGLISLGLGVIAVPKAQYYAAVSLAMIAGLIIGELFYLEKRIGTLAHKARGTIDKILPTKNDMAGDEFIERFVSIAILFCISGTGFFGSIHEGITGDPSILYIKTLLDFFTAGIFAISLGLAVASIAIPQMIVQLSLFYLAVIIMPHSTDAMRADFTATGGLIMLATGLRIMGIKQFPVANMIPSLILVMPISHYWAKYIA